MEARVCLDDGLEAVLDLLLHKGYGCALELLEHDQLEDGLVDRALALARELELNEVLDVLGLADAVEEEVDHLLPAPHVDLARDLAVEEELPSESRPTTT